MKLWQKILLVVAVLVVLGSIGTASNGDGESQVSDPAPADPQGGDEAEGSEDGEVSASASEGRECDEYDDVTSGRPLCEFVDAASYPYRLRLARNVETVLPAVQDLAPWTEATNLTDLYGTCEDITRGLPDAEITSNAVLRFSGGSDEQLSGGQADQLVQIASQEICPRA